MKVADYDAFVRRTDQYKDKTTQERRAIALYGVVGEIGSLLSAVKKKLLAEDGQTHWDKPNEEIIWELGDVIWYCFSLAQIENEGRQVNVLTNDIALLKREIGSTSQRAQKIHAALDASRKDAFLAAARDFPRTLELKFSDYQRLAYLTARTDGRILMEVSLAVLWQLGAELLRRTLPEIELTLNKNVADRPVNVILGEVAWHLAAVASLYELSLDEVVLTNVEKVSFRADRTAPTPFHDAIDDPSQQFPRRFEVSFVSIGPGHSRMYVNGGMLGDTLTDNAYADDGYRFHDVMHLSSIAHLSWSPVFRGFLNRKRKGRGDKTDEVEDGARAKLVEEVVLKAIHSEGVRLAKEKGAGANAGEIVRHFPTRSAITFRLLKALREHVDGLEVQNNKFWEWEDAIFEGAQVFYELRKEQQGTITIDMDERSLTFSPIVAIDLKGVVVGVGSSIVSTHDVSDEAAQILTAAERDSHGPETWTRCIAAKKAIFAALGFDTPSSAQMLLMTIRLLDGGRVCVKASGEVRERTWKLAVIAHQLTSASANDCIYCTAVALADGNAK